MPKIANGFSDMELQVDGYDSDHRGGSSLCSREDQSHMTSSDTRKTFKMLKHRKSNFGIQKQKNCSVSDSHRQYLH